MMPSPLHDVGVVAIGRNEGRRLRRCLDSVVSDVDRIVYVDSGSTDDSVDHAAALGVEVVHLDTMQPFTAARARNAGAARLRDRWPQVRFIQFVDGDCEVVEGWLARAREALLAQPDRAVVCGRRLERDTGASLFNRLIDIEWNTPVGEAKSCGGDSMVRAEAFAQVGGFDATLIAGEEPELCLRLRRAGWKIMRIDRDMTRHDADLHHFSQWWRRGVRCGWAYAEGRARYGADDEAYRVREVRSVLEWTMLLPAVALGLAWWTWGASLLLFSGYVALYWRVRRRMIARGYGLRDASLYARYCVLGKFAELQGMARFAASRLLQREARIIEYKSPAARRNSDARGAGREEEGKLMSPKERASEPEALEVVQS